MKVLEGNEVWAVLVETDDKPCREGWWTWNGEALYSEEDEGGDKVVYSGANSAFESWSEALWPDFLCHPYEMWSITPTWLFMIEQLFCEGLLPWE